MTPESFLIITGLIVNFLTIIGSLFKMVHMFTNFRVKLENRLTLIESEIKKG